jgi:hypothetical protein
MKQFRKRQANSRERPGDEWAIIVPTPNPKPSRKIGRRFVIDAFSVSSVAFLTTVIWWAWNALVLGGMGGIRGKVIDLDGAPVSGVTISISERDLTSASNLDGTFSFPEVSEGAYWMEFALEEGGLRMMIVVEEGKQIDLGEIPIYLSRE